MASPVVSERFRALLCRHCGKPIRVPALVTKRESEFSGPADPSDLHYQLTSRVFSVRCRNCQREAVYSIHQIVDYTNPLANSFSDRKAAAV